MVRSEDFVGASKAIRKVLHRFGIHSSTIQPEIVGTNAHVSGAVAADMSVRASFRSPCCEDVGADSGAYRASRKVV